MAKIDISKIEGFASMTAEQKIAALQGFDFPDPDYSGYVKKDLYDKAASELAAKKKELKDKLSDDERKKQEEAEKWETMQQELSDLRKEKTVAGYKAKLVAQGYDEALADATAAAMESGDMATVFANSQKFLEDYAKKVVADKLKGTPRGADGGTGGAAGMDYAKQIEEANSRGDIAAAAYYTRLQAQAEAENKQ